MSNNKFKLIKGGGNKISLPKYIFKDGYVTNTRLMGVIGMKLYWETEEGEEYVQFFHLDWEEYGIDGFDSLTNGRDNEIKLIESKMMGGLGGKLVKITDREAIFILKEANKISIEKNQILPEPRDEYDFLLSIGIDLNEEEIRNLWKKMCVPMETEIQLINYFLMRSIGYDIEGQRFLGSPNLEKFVPTGKPSTLIKNVVEFSHEEDDVKYYTCESVIDFENGYQLLISHIGVKKMEKDLKVYFAEIKNKMRITTIEAAFQLKKSEYIIIYDVEDFVELMEMLDIMKPNAMQNIHEGGFLYTEFNPNNEHVKDANYYLNGDTYGVYYVTSGEQLAVGTFVEENLKEIRKFFKGKAFQDNLKFQGEFKADSPLIYEFVQSGIEDFYEFIDENE